MESSTAIGVTSKVDIVRYPVVPRVCPDSFIVGRMGRMGIGMHKNTSPSEVVAQFYQAPHFQVYKKA